MYTTFIFTSCFIWTKPVEAVSSETQCHKLQECAVPDSKGMDNASFFHEKLSLWRCVCCLVWLATPRVPERHLWAQEKAHREREISSKFSSWSKVTDPPTDLLSCIYIKHNRWLSACDQALRQSAWGKTVINNLKLFCVTLTARDCSECATIVMWIF